MQIESPLMLAIYAAVGVFYGFLTWYLLPKQTAVDYVAKLLAARLGLSLHEAGALRKLRGEITPRISPSHMAGCGVTFVILVAVVWLLRPRYVIVLIVVSWIVRLLLTRMESRDLSRHLPALREGLEWRLETFTRLNRPAHAETSRRLLEGLREVESELQHRKVELPPSAFTRNSAPQAIADHFSQTR